MDGNSIPLARSVACEIDERARSSVESIIEFYEEAGIDYAQERLSFLIDLGCGMGAISRSVAKNYPNTAMVILILLAFATVDRLLQFQISGNMPTQRFYPFFWRFLGQ